MLKPTPEKGRFVLQQSSPPVLSTGKKQSPASPFTTTFHETHSPQPFSAGLGFKVFFRPCCRDTFRKYLSIERKITAVKGSAEDTHCVIGFAEFRV